MNIFIAPHSRLPYAARQTVFFKACYSFPSNMFLRVLSHSAIVSYAKYRMCLQ